MHVRLKRKKKVSTVPWQPLEHNEEVALWASLAVLSLSQLWETLGSEKSTGQEVTAQASGPKGQWDNHVTSSPWYRKTKEMLHVKMS